VRPYDGVNVLAGDLERLPSCPACGGTQAPSQRTFVRGRFGFDRCRFCNLLYMNPGPSAAFLSRFYGGRYWALTNVGRTEFERLRKQFRRALVFARAIENFAPRAGSRVLEVGAGLGGAVWALARRFELEPFCYEPDSEASAFAERIGVTAMTTAEFDSTTHDGSFALVILSHVLEHQADPRELLENALRFLAPDGILLVEVPNGMSLRDGGIEHPLVFTPFALRFLLRDYFAQVKVFPHNGPDSLFTPPGFVLALATVREPQPNRARFSRGLVTLERAVSPLLRWVRRRKLFVRVDRIASRPAKKASDRELGNLFSLLAEQGISIGRG